MSICVERKNAIRMAEDEGSRTTERRDLTWLRMATFEPCYHACEDGNAFAGVNGMRFVIMATDVYKIQQLIVCGFVNHESGRIGRASAGLEEEIDISVIRFHDFLLE